MPKVKVTRFLQGATRMGFSYAPFFIWPEGHDNWTLADNSTGHVIAKGLTFLDARTRAKRLEAEQAPEPVTKPEWSRRRRTT